MAPSLRILANSAHAISSLNTMGNKHSKGQRLGGPEPEQAKAVQHARTSSKTSRAPKSDKGAAPPAAPAPASKSAKKGGKMLGGSDGGASVPDPRQAAAEAAERRMKAVGYTCPVSTHGVVVITSLYMTGTATGYQRLEP